MPCLWLPMSRSFRHFFLICQRKEALYTEIPFFAGEMYYFSDVLFYYFSGKKWLKNGNISLNIDILLIGLEATLRRAR